MRRHAIATAALALVAGTALLAGTAPASAATSSPLLVSADGSTFTSSITTPLFDSAFRIVPRDSSSRDLWVRNAGAAAGRMRIDLLKASSSDPDLAAALSVSVVDTGGAGSATTTTVAGAGACTVLLTAVTLQPGQTAHLTATVALGDVSGDTAQGASATFGFRAVLTDAAVPAPTDPTSCAIGGGTSTEIPGSGGDGSGTDPVSTPSASSAPSSGGSPSAGPGDPSGSLAHTGTESVAQALGVAALALLGGAFFLLLARRRRRGDDEA